MLKIKIADIENSENKYLHLDIEETITEIDADVTARLDLVSLGDSISVSGNIQGSTRLVCDRCLSEYDYKFDFDIDEIYAKNRVFEDELQEVEIKDGEFVIDLNGSDEIDVYDLLYQSVILSLPNKKVCGINCKEDLFEKDESFDIHDERMDVFKTIKIENQSK